MTTVEEVLRELEKLGSEQTRRIYLNHGAPPDQMFGVKVGDLKPLVKQLKGQQQLALDLYKTGNCDAMYLAGMVADGRQMTKQQLEEWAKQASWYMISEYTVAWVASESPYARELAMKWIRSKNETLATSGWTTYAALVATVADEELDLEEIRSLLEKIGEGIQDAPNRVRYTMNAFVIAVGVYVRPLVAEAKRIAQRIGKVHVDMGGTACKVPLAADYIAKVEATGKSGAKRKTVRC